MAEQSKKARHNNTCYHRKFCDLRIVLYVTVVSETTHEVGLTSWQKRVSTSSVIVLHRPVLEMSTATERAAKSHRQEFFNLWNRGHLSGPWLFCAHSRAEEITENFMQATDRIITSRLNFVHLFLLLSSSYAWNCSQSWESNDQEGVLAATKSFGQVDQQVLDVMPVCQPATHQKR